MAGEEEREGILRLHVIATIAGATELNAMEYSDTPRSANEDSARETRNMMEYSSMPRELQSQSDNRRLESAFGRFRGLTFVSRR